MPLTPAQREIVQKMSAGWRLVEEGPFTYLHSVGGTIHLFVEHPDLMALVDAGMVAVHSATELMFNCPETAHYSLTESGHAEAGKAREATNVK